MTFVLYKDKRFKWRWHLKLNSGKIIAESAESFDLRSSAIQSIGLIKEACFHEVKLIQLNMSYPYVG